MSATIEIQDDLFCEMIFSLLDQVDAKYQIDWLKKYGVNFYDLGLYKFIEDKHTISEKMFTDITSKFWDKEVQYQIIKWADLSKILGDDFYENYLGFGFNSKQTITDISSTMEAYNQDVAKRYYSPMLFKSIAEIHGLLEEDIFYFTKAIMPNNDICIVFKIKTKEQEYFYNIISDPT